MGASLLKQLAAVSRPPEPVVDHVSIESAIVDAGVYADGNIDSLVDIASEVDRQAEKLSAGVCVADSLSNIIDETVNAYGEDGIDAAGAEVLKLSVESVLRAAGINIPVEMVVPSFESSSQYSTEVIDKKDNILSRIFSWLYSALKAIVDSITAFWLRLTTSAKSIEDYAKKVNEKIKTVKGEVKDADATINLGGSSIWLTDRNERIAKPDRQIVETVARFEDFVVDWRKLWGGIIDFPLPASVTDAKQLNDINDKLKALAKDTVKGTAVIKIDITAGYRLEVKPGAGEVPMMSATCKIEPNVSGKDHMAPILTIPEMKDGIGTAIDAFGVLKKLEADMGKLGTITDKVSKLSKGVSVKGEDGVKDVELRQSLKALSKACAITSWGWTNSIPYYLKTIKACVRYIDASANRYS